MNRTFRGVVFAVALAGFSRSAVAQQRPLVTEDPETIGLGRVLLEAGVTESHDYHNPASGLKGNLLTIPSIGISVGVGSIAELQIDGGLYNSLSITSRDPNAPLAFLLTGSGDTVHDFSNSFIGLKTRLWSETPSRPAVGIRFSTKLPNASSEKGIDIDTTDFYSSVLIAKTVQSVRVVANVGAGILADPVIGHHQNDVFTYGLSFARAMTQAAEFVGEINGRVSTRSGVAFPGTESRGTLKFGGRYTTGSVRFDAAIFFGTTTFDPTIGFTVGLTYVFNVFNTP